MRLSSIFLLLFVLALLVCLSLNIHWSDSELWAISLGKNFLSHENPSQDYKFIFNFFLKIPFLLSADNTNVVHFSRIIFAGLGFILLWTMSTIVKYFTDSKALSGASIVLFATSTLFISQGYKVRSDLLASVFQLLSVSYFLYLFHPSDKRVTLRYRDVFIVLLLTLLMLLSTPKAIYGFLVNLTFYTSYYWFVNRSPAIRRYLLYSLVPVMFFLIVAIFRFNEFLTALDFFIKSYQESPGHPAYLSYESFSFVFDSLLRNIHIVFLFVLGFFVFKKEPANYPLLFSAALSFIFMLVHNDRLPFFIFSQFLFILVLAAVVLSYLKSAKIQNLILLFGILNGLFFLSLLWRESSNRIQIDSQKRIERYLAAHNDPLYFDATAALPVSNKIHLFPAPQHPGNEQEILRVFQKPDLDLVFFGNRLFYYFNAIYSALEENFLIEIGPGVFAKAYVIRSSSQISTGKAIEICRALRQPPSINIYAGDGFLGMQYLGKVTECSSEKLQVKTDKSFVAYSTFEPFVFYDNLSFGIIFDHKSL